MNANQPISAANKGGKILLTGGDPYMKPLISEITSINAQDPKVVSATVLLDMFFIP